MTGAGHHWFDVYVVCGGRERHVGTYRTGNRARDAECTAYRGKLPAAEQRRRDYLIAAYPAWFRSEWEERRLLSEAGRTLAKARWARKKGKQ